MRTCLTVLIESGLRFKSCIPGSVLIYQQQNNSCKMFAGKEKHKEKQSELAIEAMNNTQQKQILSPGEGRGRQISNENCCPTLASSNAGKIQNSLCSP